MTFNACKIALKKCVQIVIWSSDVALESGNILESDSSPYFEDSDLDLDLDSDPDDSDSNPMTWSWTQSLQDFDSAL